MITQTDQPTLALFKIISIFVLDFIVNLYSYISMKVTGNMKVYPISIHLPTDF